jgi:hypothetical protein
MFNYWRTASTELVALAPKTPWIGQARGGGNSGFGAGVGGDGGFSYTGGNPGGAGKIIFYYT